MKEQARIVIASTEDDNSVSDVVQNYASMHARSDLTIVELLFIIIIFSIYVQH